MKFKPELFLNELKIALRSLARVKALWATVALTLALGIGANTAIFSVVRGVLLRPLANRDEDRLIYIRQSAPGINVENATFSVPEIRDIGANLKTIKALGTFSAMDFTIVGLGEPREIHAGVVDGNYFDVMGLKSVLGRLIDARDDGPTAAGVAVLTYKFWTNQLHSDPNVLGKSVRLGSAMGTRSAEIIGVLQPSIPYPVETEIIANIVTSPHHLSATMVTGREHRMTEIFGRLAPGATIDSARAELHTVYGTMTAAHPETYKESTHPMISATLMHQQINSKASTVLWVLFAASGLLFVIACSNVANLILARTVRRESELAIRSALGATPSAIRRSLLAESLILCGSGGLAGVFIAVPMVSLLARYASRFSVRAADMTLDFSLLWLGVGLSLLAAVFLAYVPRIPSPDSSQGLGLSSSSVRVTGGSNGRLRAFAVVQITASFLLLAGAGALLMTLMVLEESRPAFETGHVIAVNLPVMSDGKTPEQINQFYRQVKQRVATVPGVDKVSTSFSTPWRDARWLSVTFAFAVEGRTVENGQDDLRAKPRYVSPGYFGTLGIPVIAGRDFNDNDGLDPKAEQVVIVSKSIAEKLFPGQDAVNRHVMWTDPVTKFIGVSTAPRRIVGVVPDLDDENILPLPNMTIYQPEEGGWSGRMLVRTQNDPYALMPTITRAIHDLEADQPVEQASTINDIRAEVLTPNRLNAIVFGGFAALALAISVVGVAGVLAFSVSGRTREFGIRLALGALPRRILAGVVFEGTVLALIGVAAGFVLGFGGARMLSRYVAELQIPGPGPLVAAGAMILLAAVVASMVPAARAARVDAASTLRGE